MIGSCIITNYFPTVANEDPVHIYYSQLSRLVVVVLMVVVVVLALYVSITMRQKYKGTSSMDCTERRSHARGIHYTSRIGTVRVKEESGADTRIIVKE